MDNSAVNDVAKAGAEPEPDDSKERVALFVTCLVDLFRPQVGFAAMKLLARAGYSADVPAQGCCGQPNFNSGDRPGAREIATRVIRRFSDYDYVVAPSGSCAAMIRCHYPTLFSPASDAHRAARSLARKTYELTAFLHDVAGFHSVDAKWPASMTYQDGCSGLRELGIREQPRKLLASVDGLELCELREPDACCGFGGMFCVKYPDISNRIVETKTRDIVGTGANYVVAGELGCLLQMEGKLHREGSHVRAVHVAEVLAGQLDTNGDENFDADASSAPAMGGPNGND